MLRSSYDLFSRSLAPHWGPPSGLAVDGQAVEASGVTARDDEVYHGCA
jgi:hypothetical protein